MAMTGMSSEVVRANIVFGTILMLEGFYLIGYDSFKDTLEKLQIKDKT
jgi:hypothetical protein